MSSNDLVTFNILVNGKPIDSTINIASIEIDKNEAKNIARIEIEANEDSFPITTNSTFVLNADIEIQLGYNNSTSSAFKGKITDKGVRLSHGIGARNIFMCEDDAPIKGSGIPNINSDSVFNIDLGCNATNHVEGGIELQGTLDYAVGSPISFDAIISGFPQAPVYSIMHEVSEGNWFTSLHFAKPATNDTKNQFATKSANTIAMDNEKDISISDANGNSITLTSSGIDIKSSKSITLSADHNVSIKGSIGITQEAAGGDVVIKGINTKINADAEATMKGNATATVQGGGELTLKGAMVMIN